LTWLDWFIGAVFGLFIFLGYRKGFVRQFFDLLGSVVSLLLAFYFYPQFGKYLAGLFHCSVPFANIIGFILIVIIISGTVSFIGKYWHKKNEDEPVALVDGLMGALLGGVKAAVILLILLVLVVALRNDNINKPIEESTFAKDLLRLEPVFYFVRDHSLPPDIPRIVVSPEGVRLRVFNERKLAGATCIACGTKVIYKGMVKQGLTPYPQTYCPKCHRISDGCLTFEGYHMLHGSCPYDKLGSIGEIDCKIWPNLEPTRVHGKCPVCGRTQ
jgi:membrane protein required for colicin V production